jgi:hypothetical protein
MTARADGPEPGTGHTRATPLLPALALGPLGQGLAGAYQTDGPDSTWLLLAEGQPR